MAESSNGTVADSSDGMVAESDRSEDKGESLVVVDVNIAGDKGSKAFGAFWEEVGARVICSEDMSDLKELKGTDCEYCKVRAKITTLCHAQKLEQQQSADTCINGITRPGPVGGVHHGQVQQGEKCADRGTINWVACKCRVRR